MLLKKINFWVYSVGTKLLPCIVLTYMSLALIRVLVEAEKRKKRLKANGRGKRPTSPPPTSVSVSTNNISVPTQLAATSTSSGSCGGAPSCGNSLVVPIKKTPRVGGHSCSTHQPSDRTTKMLLAVLLLFLLTEFPSGILTLLSGFLDDDFFQHVYQPLGEILDILALINSGINFILYCVMSRLFRKTFTKIFCPRNYYAGVHVPAEYTNYNSRKMSNCHTLAQTEFGNTVHTTLV